MRGDVHVRRKSSAGRHIGRDPYRLHCCHGDHILCADLWFISFLLSSLQLPFSPDLLRRLGHHCCTGPASRPSEGQTDLVDSINLAAVLNFSVNREPIFHRSISLHGFVCLGRRK